MPEVALPPVRCVGCGALVPDTDGPTHRYVGASPGCWQRYNDLLALVYAEYGYPAIHQTTVDAYMAQHPGVPGPQSRQSVCVHLMSLCLVVERGVPPARATRALGHFAHRVYPWLEPPAMLGSVTVLDVLGARDLAEHTARVEHWARAVWAAWSAHHATIRGWLDALPPER
jgi:hypothetical protein